MTTKHILEDGRAILYGGDNRDALKLLDDNSIDSIVTDPPYALVSIQKRFGKPGSVATKSDGATGVYKRASAGFMGQQWDTGEVAFASEFWAECLRVLKPGGHVVAFSGTRTYHHLALAIEEAGFEIRDQLAWVYGSGFPKSHDVAKGIDKAAGAEREIISERPAYGIGGNGVLNGHSEGATAKITAPATNEAREWQGWGTALKPAWEPIVLARKPLIGTVVANVLEHRTGAINIDGCRVGDEEMNVTSSNGVLVSENRSMAGGNYGRVSAGTKIGRWPANFTHDGSDEVVGLFPGFEARFFYCAKASRKDRDEGLEGFVPDKTNDGRAVDADNAYQRGATLRANTHPTVKPTALMQWLCRLVTPPGGVILDPFMGSGSTGKAAMLEGFNFVGCELNDKFIAISKARIEWAISQQPANDNQAAPVDAAA